MLGRPMRYCFDIDGTVCTNTDGAYEQAQPYPEAVAAINRLHEAGHYIILFTARGSSTGIDWRSVTERQMAEWGVRYHDLRLGKPHADVFIDDKAVTANGWHLELGIATPSPLASMMPAMPAPAPEPASPPPAAGGAGSVMAEGQYLELTYDTNRLPYGPYTGKLCKWLSENGFSGRKGHLLDFGCGRGEHMAAFADLGYTVAGVDISPSAPALAGPGMTVRVANLEQEPMPYPDASFDMLFSKSVVEHLRDPVTALRKTRAALKPGGLAVVMTPSWVHNAWGPFYIDHTHVTPFTAPSLRDALLFAGFEDVRVSHFHQLPFLWERPWLTPLVRAAAALPLSYRPMHETATWPGPVNTFIRFSKEVMLLAVARRPAEGR